MTHSIDDLLNVVHSYYPRRMLVDDPGYRESNEYRRLVAARRKAGAEDGTWRATLRRLERQFPADNVLNDSLGLSTGGMDAAYSCKLIPAISADAHTVGFLVSFLVPYFIVYSSRVVEDLERNDALHVQSRMIFTADTCHLLPAGADSPQIEDSMPPRPMRRVVRFDFPPEEQPYAAWITREAQAVWGYERMPPEVGKVVVSDVSTNLRYFGEATLYDCLFADDWLS